MTVEESISAMIAKAANSPRLNDSITRTILRRNGFKVVAFHGTHCVVTEHDKYPHYAHMRLFTDILEALGILDDALFNSVKPDPENVQRKVWDMYYLNATYPHAQRAKLVNAGYTREQIRDYFNEGIDADLLLSVSHINA